MVADPTAPRLGLPTKLAYGFGSIGYRVKDVAFRSFLLLYYNQVVGVGAGVLSFAILPGANAATLDPDRPRMLALAYVPALIILYIGGAGFLFANRIDRASYETSLAELERRGTATTRDMDEIPEPAQ